MISPRALFLKQPFASKVQDFIVTDEFQMALTAAVSETACYNALTAENLAGIKMFLESLNVIGEPITVEEIMRLPTLTQPDPHQLQRLKREANKGK